MRRYVEHNYVLNYYPSTYYVFHHRAKILGTTDSSECGCTLKKWSPWQSSIGILYASGHENRPQQMNMRNYFFTESLIHVPQILIWYFRLQPIFSTFAVCNRSAIWTSSIVTWLQLDWGCFKNSLICTYRCCPLQFEGIVFLFMLLVFFFIRLYILFHDPSLKLVLLHPLITLFGVFEILETFCYFPV